MLRCSFFLSLLVVGGMIRAQAGDVPTDAGANAVQVKISALEKIVLQHLPAPAAASPAPANANAGEPQETRTGPVPRELMFFYALRNNTLYHDYGNAIGAAHNLAGADGSADIATATDSIVQDLQKLQAQQQEETNKKLEALEDRVTQAIVSARDARDLDPVIQEVGQEAIDARTTLGGMQRQAAYQRVEAVNRYAKQWQKYLVDRAAGNAIQAANDLNELAAESDSYQPIPRSELLNRALGAAPGTGLVATVHPLAPSPAPSPATPAISLHTFDDIPAVLDTLQAMQRGGGFNQDANTLANSLRQLQNAHNSYQEQNYGAALQGLNFSMYGGDSGPPADTDQSPLAELRRQMNVLKDQLKLQVTQALINLPGLPDPMPGEKAADYLLRLAALKAKAADWSGLEQVLQVYQQVANPFNTQPWLMEDLAGVHAYLVGDKLEAVGQHLDAIRSYRESLATLGRYFPAEPAAAKLKDLQAKYPDLYQQALQKPISDPPSAAVMFH